MSKIGKFYSIGIDMLKGTEEGRQKAGSLDADRMEQVLNRVEDYFNKKGIYCEEPVWKPTGTVIVKVSCRNAPIIADVRLYPVCDGDTFETDYEPKGRIDFTRKYSGANGVAKIEVCEGKYLVKVSKGSEYTIFYTHVTVRAGEKVTAEAELEKFVDLSAEGFFGGDLHHHSIYSSPVWGGTDDVIESCAEVADSMRAQGLMYGALSDHHNILNHQEWKATQTEDFYPIVSKEISTSNGHVLSLGVEGYDVIYRIPDDKDRTDEYLRSEFVRITDEIRERGGLPQLNHPRDLSVSISWNRDFYDMTEVFETIEIWNGSNPMYYGTTNAMAADFWRDLLEQGRYFPATTGSDTHNIRANDYHRIYSKILWLIDRVKELKSTGEIDNFKEDKQVLENALCIAEQYLPMMEVWAATSLTSGCVRTYVHLNGDRDKERILDALRKGHSFLTNGPILTVTVNGVGMGEKATVNNGRADIKIRLLSNRKLSSLTMYTSKMRATDLPLTEKNNGSHYDYSMELKDFEVGDTSYIFFVAADGVTNMAITNPILCLS